ncbi:MAG TPA: hypothetical protein VMA77_11480 [Solirubrobacteraceae bacterium]|nr:hypothetical protein [Solirubrobacteraceae bacterium]
MSGVIVALGIPAALSITILVGLGALAYGLGLCARAFTCRFRRPTRRRSTTSPRCGRRRLFRWE